VVVEKPCTRERKRVRERERKRVRERERKRVREREKEIRDTWIL
jgi:hypothetical protein